MSDTSWTADLHVRLTRRAIVHRRVTRAATLAAIAAAVGWLLGLEPAPHALLLLVGAAAGALLPPGGRGDEAWRTIGEQAGLAYQTHVEHAGRDDPYGLLAAASVQARLSIRGVIPPRRSAWWLPLAASALALWLLSALVGTPASWWTPAPDAPQTLTGAPAPSPPPLAEPEREPDEPTDAEIAEPDPGDPARPRSPDPGAAPGVDEAGDGGEGLEREALDRFLDALRERPRGAEAEGVLRDAERDAMSDAGDADLARAELRDDPDADRGDGRQTPTDAGDDAADTDDRTELPSSGGDGERDERDVDAPDDDGSGRAEPSPDGDDAGQGDADGSGDDAEQRPQGDAGEEGPQEGSLGAEQPGLDEGAGDDAGIGFGTPGGSDDQVPESGGELEALPGLLGPGPETPGGRVRLPGRDTEVFPDGAAAAAFERAVEQAVTDGSVPVTYQEIIRNYFR